MRLFLCIGLYLMAAMSCACLFAKNWIAGAFFTVAYLCMFWVSQRPDLQE